MPWAGLSNTNLENKPCFDSTTEKYVPLDSEKWLDDHDVLKMAEQQGRADQPPSDAYGLDGTESQIVTFINSRGRKCREAVARHLSDFERDLADLENEQELAVLRQEVREARRIAEQRLEQKAGEGRTNLAIRKNEVSDAREHMKAFRRKASLTRLPDYSHRSTAWMFILGCALAEIVLNASLLMDVIPTGLLGAIGQMILISGVNVVIFGLPAAELLRNTNHWRRSRAASCWAALVVLALLVVAFNLAVGHFRDSIQAVLTDGAADVFQIGGDALRRVVDNPIGLDSFHSVLLVLLGLSCFGISSWKWLRRDDVYPEYGSRHRQLKKMENAYLRQHAEIQDQLRELYQRYESQLKDIRHKIQIKQSKLREMSRRGDRIVQEFKINMHQHQHDLNSLLRAYRTANETVRTSPVPSHFGATISVDTDILEPPSFTPPSAKVIEGLMDDVHTAIRHLQDLHRECSRSFPAFDEASRTAI